MQVSLLNKYDCQLEEKGWGGGAFTSMIREIKCKGKVRVIMPMERATIYSVLGVPFVFICCFGLLVVTASADTATAGSEAALEQQLKSIEQTLQAQRDVCLEHCGTSEACVEKCERAYRQRYENQTAHLVQKSTPPQKPTEQDKCPVCGMFVSKYPDWLGQILFKDETVAYFDGAKDLFKYYFDLKKYNPQKKPSDIAAIYVTEYYNLKSIDACKAYYVIGSDVYGPMGRELIPFEKREDAEEFMQDHKGKAVVEFQAINPALIATLD